MLDVFIIIQMVVIDVVDERNGGAQRQKALHIFAGFGDEHVMRADAHTALEDIHKAADVHGGVRLAGLADVGQHGGDGGLSVAARDADHVLVAFGQLPERDGAFQLRDAPFLRGHAFHVRGLDGGGVDHKVGVAEVIGRMPDRDRNAKLLQALRKRGDVRVGTLHGIAPVAQDLGKAVHGAAADADEVDGFVVRNVRHIRILDSIKTHQYQNNTESILRFR